MPSSTTLRSASLIIQIFFYLMAGINHFINPAYYFPLIPDYLSDFKISINLLSGAAEILLALLLIPAKTRKIAGTGIAIMLIAFIPSHVYFITANIESVGPLEVTPDMAWIRLLVIHPLLILWALSAGKKSFKAEPI